MFSMQDRELGKELQAGTSVINRHIRHAMDGAIQGITEEDIVALTDFADLVTRHVVGYGARGEFVSYLLREVAVSRAAAAEWERRWRLSQGMKKVVSLTPSNLNKCIRHSKVLIYFDFEIEFHERMHRVRLVDESTLQRPVSPSVCEEAARNDRFEMAAEFLARNKVGDDYYAPESLREASKTVLPTLDHETAKKWLTFEKSLVVFAEHYYGTHGHLIGRADLRRLDPLSSDPNEKPFRKRVVLNHDGKKVNDSQFED